MTETQPPRVSEDDVAMRLATTMREVFDELARVNLQWPSVLVEEARGHLDVLNFFQFEQVLALLDRNYRRSNG